MIITSAASQNWKKGKKRVKAVIEKKNFSICPKLLINVELYGLLLAPRLKKSKPSNLGSQFATLGADVPAFINILTSMFWHLLITWGPNNKPKMLKVGPQVFPALTPSVKRALITLEDFMSK
jgi:hypothetical protein